MGKVDDKRREKILNGNIFYVILIISGPIFLYNFLNSFYNLFDSIVVSKINPNSVSAVASIGQIKNLFSSIGTGLAAGGGILVARKFGAGDYSESKIYANVLLKMGIIVVIFLYSFCIPLAIPIMKLSGVPDELILIGTSYFIVCIIDLGIIVFNSIFIAMSKAKGSTSIIFLLNLISMGIKLFLNWLFIYVLNVDDIIWVSLATLFSQLFIFLVFIVLMLSKNNILKIELKCCKLASKYTREILKISLPIFFGKFVFAFGKVSVNSMCKEYGTLVVGALGVSNNINGIVTSPLGSFEDGESTIISHNLGNRNLKRTMQVFIRTFFLCVILGSIGYILIRFIYQDSLISLFSQNKEADNLDEFLTTIKCINRFDSLSIPSLAINSAVLGVLYGFGKTRTAMVLNISRVFVFRIPSLWILKTFYKNLGAECAGISMAISNIGIATVSLIFLIAFLFQIRYKGHDGMYFNDSLER